MGTMWVLRRRFHPNARDFGVAGIVEGIPTKVRKTLDGPPVKVNIMHGVRRGCAASIFHSSRSVFFQVSSTAVINPPYEATRMPVTRSPRRRVTGSVAIKFEVHARTFTQCHEAEGKPVGGETFLRVKKLFIRESCVRERKGGH